MQRSIIYTLIILSSFISSQSNLGMGKLFYDNREQGRDELVASTKSIDEAIRIFEVGLLGNPQSEEAVEYLLKSYYYRAEYATTNIEEKKTFFDKGKVLGLDYINKYPESIEFRYWYLANLGGWAKVYGILTAAREGVADQMKLHAEKIIEMDSSYRNGGGYYLLGAVHYKSPYIPFLLSWPDNDDAVKFLTLAVETGNAELTQLNYLAQALYKDGQVIEAKELLNRVINTEPNFENLIEDLNYIQEAKILLKDM
jgi:tetratricopeptide (TPR) repeat protein